MADRQWNMAELSGQIVSDFYAPAVALVTTNLEYLHISGPIERYFNPERLKLSSDLVAAAHPGLRDKLHQALLEAISNDRRVVVFHDQPGSSHPFSIDVRPTSIEAKRLFLVCLAGDHHLKSQAPSGSPESRSLIMQAADAIARPDIRSLSDSIFSHTDAMVKVLPAPIGHTDIVLVIEDDPKTRGLLQLILMAAGHTVALAADARAAIEMMVRGSIRPDMILGDYKLLRRADQLGATSIVRETFKRIPTVALIGDTYLDFADNLRFENLVLLNKPVRASELAEVVQRLLTQRTARSGEPGLRQLVEPRRSGIDLTERQHQILQRVLAGDPSKNIAADLGISRRTVENHRASIMRKTGAKSIADLARIALAAARRNGD
jgi:FixJ family two-component response regulator